MWQKCFKAALFYFNITGYILQVTFQCASLNTFDFSVTFLDQQYCIPREDSKRSTVIVL